MTFLKSPTNQLYSTFLFYSNGVFGEALLTLQSDAPKVHCLHHSLHNLLLKIMMRFVKPTAMKQHGQTEMDAVQYKLAYHEQINADLMIGAEASKFISVRETNRLRQVRNDELFSSVRTYFATECDYLDYLKRTKVADISLQTNAKSADLVFFVKTFPALMPAGSTHDSLLEALTEYQCTTIDDCVRERMDLSWNAPSDKKNGGGV